MSDFKSAATSLLAQAESFLYKLFPLGYIEGNEFKIGSLSGEDGKSLSVNIKTGVWKDFSSGEGGADLISLYAAKHNIKQYEALTQLGFKEKPKKPSVKNKITYRYTDNLEVVRLEYEDGSKTFFPQNKLTGEKKWPEGLRPLYIPTTYNINLPNLIVEGEKCAQFLSDKLKKFNVITWGGGANAVGKSNWSVLTNLEKPTYLWPDYDQAGFKAMASLNTILKKQGFKATSLIDVRKDPSLEPDQGLDVVDIWPKLNTEDGFIEWAKTIKQTSIEFEKPIEQQQTPISVKSNAILPIQSSIVEGEDAGLATNRSGYVCNERNVVMCLLKFKEFQNYVYFDVFYNAILIYDDELKDYRKIRDRDLSRLLIKLQGLGFEKLSQSTLMRALEALGFERSANHPLEWLKTLTWDKTERLKYFYRDYAIPGLYYAEDRFLTYRERLGQNMLTAMVARMCDPGCKYDNLIIWEGVEGIFKSTALKILGGRYYLSQFKDAGSNDFDLNTTGFGLVEMQELCGFNELSDAQMKAFLSTDSTTFRKAYGINAEEFRRSCILVGTTNKQKYFKDTQNDGLRRCVPIWLEKIHLNKIKEDRDQLFAEAYHLYKSGYEFWDFCDEEHKQILEIKHPTVSDEDNEGTDVWSSLIEIFLDSIPEYKRGPFSTRFIYLYALDGKNDMAHRLSKSKVIQINKTLRNMGFKIYKPHGKQRLWVSEKFTKEKPEMLTFSTENVGF